MDIKNQDFNLCTNWQRCEFSHTMRDPLAARSYPIQQDWTARLACAGLAVASPVVHAVALVCQAAYRTFHVLILGLSALCFFIGETPERRAVQMKRIDQEVREDLTRIVMTPIAYLGLEFASLYGIFRPQDGAKLYATFERLEYNTPLLAPCFQPTPSSDLLSTDY